MHLEVQDLVAFGSNHDEGPFIFKNHKSFSGDTVLVHLNSLIRKNKRPERARISKQLNLIFAHSLWAIKLSNLVARIITCYHNRDFIIL